MTTRIVRLHKMIVTKVTKIISKQYTILATDGFACFVLPSFHCVRLFVFSRVLHMVSSTVCLIPCERSINYKVRISPQKFYFNYTIIVLVEVAVRITLVWNPTVFLRENSAFCETQSVSSTDLNLQSFRDQDLTVTRSFLVTWECQFFLFSEGSVLLKTG